LLLLWYKYEAEEKFSTCKPGKRLGATWGSSAYLYPARAYKRLYIKDMSEGGSAMKKIVWLMLVTVILVLASSLPSQAEWRGGHDWHGGGHFRGSIWIGPGWWGPPAYPYWYPYRYPYYYPYYSEPPVIIERQAPVYVQPNQQQEEQNYWYYCKKPQGYYPYVNRCPGGWLKVVPSAPTDSETRNNTESPQNDRQAKDAPPSGPKGERY
jgi:hypothetical protein